jgi:hypothetical protein
VQRRFSSKERYLEVRKPSGDDNYEMVVEEEGLVVIACRDAFADCVSFSSS